MGGSCGPTLSNGCNRLYTAAVAEDDKPTPKRTTWPVAVQAEAMRMYVTDGPHAAARATGVPYATVASWARRRGLHMVDQNTRVPVEAIEALRARRAVIREELGLRMLAQALRLVQRMEEPHVEYVAGSGGPQPVAYPHAPAKATQAYGVAVAILLDKYRLEQGEATERSESGPIPQATGHMTDEDRVALRQWLDTADLSQLAAPPQDTDG